MSSPFPVPFNSDDVCELCVDCLCPNEVADRTCRFNPCSVRCSGVWTEQNLREYEADCAEDEDDEPFEVAYLREAPVPGR